MAYCLAVSGVKATSLDSLHRLVLESQADTHRVNLLNDMGKLIKVSEADSAEKLFARAGKLAESLDFHAGAGRAWLYRCQALTAIGQYDEALQDAETSRKYFDRAGMIDGIGKAWNSTGVIHYYRGELGQASASYAKALEHFSNPFYIATTHNNLAQVLKLNGDGEGFLKHQLSAWEKFAELKNKEMELYCLGNVSIFYMQRGDLEKAREYNLKGYECLEGKGSKEELIFLDAAKAEIMTLSGDSAEAMKIFQSVRALASELNLRHQEATAWSNMAAIYMGWKDYSAAEERYEKALAIFEQMEDPRGQAVVTASLAAIRMEAGDVDGGIRLLHSSLEMAENLGEPTVLAGIYDKLSLAYTEAGDAEKALVYRNLYVDTQKELGDPQKMRKIMEMDRRFEFERKEKLRQELVEGYRDPNADLRNWILGGIATAVLLLGGGIYLVVRLLTRKPKLPEPNPEGAKASSPLADAEAQGRIMELRALLAEKEQMIRELQAEKPDAVAPAMLPPFFETLTAREIEVFLCIGEGLSDKEAAEELSVSPATVRTHARNVYSKLNVSNRAEVVKMAYEYRLLRRNN